MRADDRPARSAGSAGDADSGAAGLRMPAEWEPHEATWLSWPHDRDTWPGIFERIPPVWAELVRELREGELVRILSRDDAMDREIAAFLDGDLGGVELVRLPTSDVWIRDYGPLFVLAGERDVAPRRASVEITAWRFNAWGGKYPWMESDRRVPARIGELCSLPVHETAIVLEGGSIDVDGEGTLLTTESCLLHRGRNPELDRTGIEARLRRWLGAEQVIWLGDGIAGDDTDGHVDDLTRFVAPGVVVTAVETDSADENYRALLANRDRLAESRDARGRRLEIVELPMPPAVRHRDAEGRLARCPASYANFYIANDAVLVPTFRSHRDEEALGVLREVFPGRRVVGIDCHDVVLGLGALHCVSQQQPAADRGAPR